MKSPGLSKGEKNKKRLLKLALLFLILVGLAMILFTPVDDTPFQDTGFYRETIAGLDSIGKVIHGDPGGKVSIGWGQANIAPPTPVRLTGNRRKPYESIYDSVFVRSFIFSNNRHKIALISYDLWIIHPHLAGEITRRINTSDLGITGIYFTASHTHSSIGGWAKGLLGKLVVGGNDKKTLDYLGQMTLKSLRQAEANTGTSRIGFGSVSTRNMVRNRLSDTARLDDKIRLLKIQHKNGEQAVFTTFSAHSVYMDKNINGLSADYPGPFLTFLTGIDSIKFASFAAGAMGNHSPIRRGSFAYEKMLQYSRELASYVAGSEDEVEMDSTTVLKFAQWPVSLRSPHFRITDRWRVRPWLFHWVLGKEPSYITCLRVGNTVLLGLPVELSGEFYPEFAAICQEKGISLMITSFNGNYMGYVNPERYYNTIRKPETREMNWTGPQSGEYMVALIQEILAII
ncbi:neutral/alkaline non-lysosomal ceramidase N-terminal domain-containing protein [Fulvivirgaceae bacterium BMA12]|uniref:Neutral/alkaline non-lysosomal ceramidase N-terminal domain-containing protein n=1 Tax=Agaribacillus aureus TaxID=3051825 RepID=A0ABT8L7C7_9BACT|nr:neutral/alkaline non-lysosomal ceramidase N-terminal domain-containing protein [Fulvivirgaceae bacterium BMA12]